MDCLLTNIWTYFCTKFRLLCIYCNMANSMHVLLLNIFYNVHTSIRTICFSLTEMLEMLSRLSTEIPLHPYFWLDTGKMHLLWNVWSKSFYFDLSLMLIIRVCIAIFTKESAVYLSQCFKNVWGNSNKMCLCWSQGRNPWTPRSNLSFFLLSIIQFL